MKIRTPDSVQPERSRPAAQAAPSNLRSAWLRELERAQLQGWFGNRLAPNADMARSRDPEHPPAARPGARPAAPASESASAASISFVGDAGDGTAPETGRPVPESKPGESAPEPGRTLEAPARALERPFQERGPAPAEGSVAPGPTPQPVQAGGADLHPAPAIRPPEKTADAGAPARAAPPVPAKPWPARSIHMMSDGSGARVWIRDSGLAQTSAGAILSSLAGELRLRGLRLRALTVNGRVEFETEPASGSGKASRSTFSQEVKRHGND